MNVITAYRYLGCMLFCGCSVGFLFTLIFIAVLGFSGFQALYALGFFGSFAATGLCIVRFDWREKGEDSCEKMVA